MSQLTAFLLLSRYTPLTGFYQEASKAELVFVAPEQIVAVLHVCFAHERRRAMARTPLQTGEHQVSGEPWDKVYEIATLTRRDLQTLGLLTTQVDSLSDEDLQAIAQEMTHLYVDHAFWEDLQFVVRLYLAEKGGGNAL
jgi:hypothetical protein